MDRRRFLLTSLAGALAVPLGAGAQYRAGKVPRVGILNSDTAQDARVDEFREGLRKLGYVEGQNLLITYRWADGRLDRLPALVDDLLASHVDVIVAIGASVWAAKRKTSTVPIVMAFTIDGPSQPRNIAAALGFLQLPPRAPELRLLHRWLDTWTGVGLIVVGVERQGLRLSLSHIADHEWRARFMSNPMFAPAGFGVAKTPWLAVQRVEFSVLK